MYVEKLQKTSRMSARCTIVCTICHFWHIPKVTLPTNLLGQQYPLGFCPFFLPHTDFYHSTDCIFCFAVVGLCIRLVTASMRCEGRREMPSKISNNGEVKQIYLCRDFGNILKTFIALFDWILRDGFLSELKLVLLGK